MALQIDNSRDYNYSALSDWVPTEIHDWEGKERDVLVLNYTLACPLACDFCCYNCHSKRAEKMPIELAFRLVEEAAELGTFSSIGFTGGEPMLFFEELLKIGNRLKDLSLPFTIATAAHWAESFEESLHCLTLLKNRGLNRLNISHDPSHARFVSSNYVINAATAADQLNIPTYIVGTFYSLEQTLESFVPGIAKFKKVKLINKYVSKIGRAKKRNITQETYNLNLNIDQLCCYRRIFHDIVVFFDGATYPCCSTFNRSTNGILLGNANHMSLRELWQRAEGSLKYRLMKRQGFGKLYEVLSEYAPELAQKLPSAKEVVGPCSLCNMIFSNEEMTLAINDAFSEYEKDKILTSLSNIENLVGKSVTKEMVNDILTSANIPESIPLLITN